MSWNAYKIVLRLRSPMHIGQTKLGNLQRTRPYVLGKNLWGALTSRITRDSTPAKNDDYRRVGQQVNDELAFSYFYPTSDEQIGLWPWDDPDQFSWQYLGAYASTALNYLQNSAEEGSLHETEFIAPTTRSGKVVNLVGYIFEKEDCSLPWKMALNRLQMGGERTYGWGRVDLCHISSGTTDVFGYYSLHLTGDRPGLMPNGNKRPLLAHTLAVGTNAVMAQGRLAPVVGRETRIANAHGRELSTASVCWEPGAVYEGSDLLEISPYGFWHASR